jgi:hypothetical protein
LTYETTEADENGQPFLDVTVLDEQDNEVGGRVIFEEGIEKEIVRESPGSFTLELRAEDLTYEITIEDCTGKEDPEPTDPPTDEPDPPTDDPSGGDAPGEDQEPVDTAPIPADQYEGHVDGEDAVIDDTVPEEPLPNTGGVPLLGLVSLGIVFLSVVFVILRLAIRPS